MKSASATAGSTATVLTGFSDIHPDIIETHILTRLDGCSLAAVNSTSSQLRSLSSRHDLWSHICQSTWPSTGMPRVQQVISTFPKGPLSFFSLASSPLIPSDPYLPSALSTAPNFDLLISAVDIFYRSKAVLSKICETETVTGWFKSAPFRIDLLDPKEIVSTPIPRPNRDDTCPDLYRDLELSWIVMDPIGRRAVNVSSVKPVTVHRHWLSGEIQAKFATVIGGAGNESPVVITVEVTFTAGAGEGEEEGMGVREVALEVEGLGGPRLSGSESVRILSKELEGGKWRKRREEEEGEVEEKGRKRYVEFMEMRRERRARKTREEERRDLMCAGVGVVGIVFATVGCFVSLWS